MLTLIIPIGPPGSGKSTLGKLIKEKIGNSAKFYISSRDEEYAKVTEEQSSKKKARRILFDRMINFFRVIKEDESKEIVVYMDSCNGKKEIRDKFIKDLNPGFIIYINYRFTDLEFLISRTISREDHPTFPKEENRQRKTIINCCKSISYETTENDRQMIIDVRNESMQENILNYIFSI